MVQVRKQRAGNASHGYVWSADGAVVEVAEEHVAGLLRIPDGGFAVVEQSEPAHRATSTRAAGADRRRPSGSHPSGGK